MIWTNGETRTLTTGQPAESWMWADFVADVTSRTTALNIRGTQTRLDSGDPNVAAFDIRLESDRGALEFSFVHDASASWVKRTATIGEVLAEVIEKSVEFAEPDKAAVAGLLGADLTDDLMAAYARRKRAA
jgi:hypothetical protein